jgi:hypothetical protein
LVLLRRRIEKEKAKKSRKGGTVTSPPRLPFSFSPSRGVQPLAFSGVTTQVSQGGGKKPPHNLPSFKGREIEKLF